MDTSIFWLLVRSKVSSFVMLKLLALSGVTCTVVDAETLEPSVAVAVMTASPTLLAVIMPVASSTLATATLPDAHFSFWLSAAVGLTL